MSDRPRTIVHIHGAADCAEIWLPVATEAERLGGEFVPLDLPMHGSNDDIQPDSIEGYADWVQAHLEHEGLVDIVLSGHSMGSLVALEVAGRGEGRVGALLLLAAGHPMSVTEDLLLAANDDVERACTFLATWGSTPETQRRRAKEIATHRDLSISLAAGVVAADLHACNTYRGAVTAAARVAVPTMVVVGERDKLVPPSRAMPIVAALGDVEHITLDGVGHAFEHECPETIAGLAMQLAARV